MCYWPEREKEGQFPPDFGKRGRFKGSAINTCQSSTKLSPTVNVASRSKDNDYHKWSLTICDGCFDTLKSSKMQS